MLHCVFHFLYCMVVILCISLLCAESIHMNKCMETERRALVKFKDALILQRGSLSSWEDEDCCKWEGISCDNFTHHVTSLDLLAFRLSGKLDSSICELKHLTSLNLGHNYLEGNIPKCIGSLDNLIELDLSGNKLVSVIPPSIGNLSNLQTLKLEYNFDMISNDLEWLSHLPNLRYLDLTSLNLSLAVDWLSSISKIPFLSTLNLYNCGLNQVTPKYIQHLNSSISLKSLDLSNNGLNSSIVPWVINVSKVLTHLDLSYNELQGSILLKSFRNMSKLQELRLDSNKLSGKLSDNIQQLCYVKNGLKYLHLSNNPFNARPLPNFSCFPFLETLNLRNTNVVGQFPNTIGQLSSLTKLYLSSNKLSGVINEVHLSNLSQLKTLDVSQNSLSFNLSSDWVPPFKLETLHASSCTLGPQFPGWLKHQRKLLDLDISNCSISDSFPKWFWKLSLSLQYLNVSHNLLKGMLPKSYTKTKVYYDYDHELHVWDFSFNNLNGSLPAFPELLGLFLSNNMFTGSMSSFCTSLSHKLINLDISSNLLVGPLSDCWEKFQSLEVLNLAENNLLGKLPNSFGSLQKIESLHLNNNNFSGEIPSLILCPNLKLIDLGDNNLHGSLPMWIGHHLHQLIVLRLRANKFQGSIPTSMCNLSLLQILDLSQNNITGEIPQCFSHIVALSNLTSPRHILYHLSISVSVDFEVDEIVNFNDKEILAWKGSNREYGKILGLMRMIDLSCNHLTGEIPQSITKLVALASLNLSRNNLTGLIPTNIGHMERLESLDLSINHLYGRMPTSFSNLTFLSYMNLSFNNLEGKIPLSTQLQSFDPSTYVGNNRLCGPPLINLCPEDVISPTISHDKHVTNEEDEDKLITFGFYVSLVIGFFVGFWGVCGTLVIKTSWRHAYFKFFNNMNDWIHVTLAVFVNRLKKRFQVED